MVVETYRGGAAKSVCQRVREKGRMLPDGLTFLNSWVKDDLSRCYQLMECKDPALLQSWAAKRSDLIEFEFVPVLTSEQAASLAAQG